MPVQRIEMHCKGISPLLMDKYHDGEGDTVEETAEMCLYRMPSGRLCIPCMNFFACVSEAWRLIELDPEISPGSIKTLDLNDKVLGMDRACMLLTGSKQYELHIVKGYHPQRKGPVGIVRPRFDNWGFLVYLWFDDKLIPEAPLQRLIDSAGSFIGLGAHRGTCGGPYGRFSIDKWQPR